MNRTPALLSGIVGASILTIVHESVRRFAPNAPRADILGMRAVDVALRALDMPRPREERLHQLALVGDLVANSAYYSLIGVGAVRHPWRRGALLGMLAGIAAVVLPSPLGLGRQPTRRTPATQAMTVVWYLAGGLAAAAAARRVRSPASI